MSAFTAALQNRKEEIEAAIARARLKPLPKELAEELRIKSQTIIVLDDRKPDAKRPESEHVDLGGSMRASISFEEQPIGLVKHLSVSIDGF